MDSCELDNGQENFSRGISYYIILLKTFSFLLLWQHSAHNQGRSGRVNRVSPVNTVKLNAQPCT